MDDERKDHFDSETPPQRNHPKQLQTHNVPNYDVENTNGTNKERDLPLANKPWIVPRVTQRMLQRIQRHRRGILHY